MQLSYHVTYFSQIMGYNLKYLEWKKPVENITTAKFEAPGTKEWDFLTVWISSKKFQIWMEKLLESKTLFVISKKARARARNSEKSECPNDGKPEYCLNAARTRRRKPKTHIIVGYDWLIVRKKWKPFPQGRVYFHCGSFLDFIVSIKNDYFVLCDRPGEGGGSSEKNCCWWLTSRQPEWKSSSNWMIAIYKQFFFFKKKNILE